MTASSASSASWSSSGFRAPTRIVATAGCRATNCSAATRSGTPCDSVRCWSAATRARISGDAGLVAVERPVDGVGEDPAAERAADHHGDVAALAEREETPGGALVEERVAVRGEDEIGIGPLDEPFERLRRVHAEADRPHDALVAPLREQRERLLDSGLEMVVGIVHVDDVDRGELEALQALLERSCDGVAAEVEGRAARRRADEHLVRRPLGGRLDELPHLRRDRERTALASGERLAGAALRLPVSVRRRDVEVVEARRERRVDEADAGVVVHRGEEPAHRREADAERRKLDAGGTDRGAWSGHFRGSSGPSA